MKNNEKLSLPRWIKCPKCGAEFTPSEILYPDSVLGKPSSLIKDEHGKIIVCIDDNYSDTESYTCDYCGEQLQLNVKLNIDVKKESDIDFDTDYISPIYKFDRLVLPEHD